MNGKVSERFLWSLTRKSKKTQTAIYIYEYRPLNLFLFLFLHFILWKFVGLPHHQ